jgi:cardiolipin synthase
MIAAISDFFDGYLARKWQVVSPIGTILDPLADKVMMISAYGSLAVAVHVPLYVSATVITRDLLILTVVCFCMLRGIDLEIKPLMSSKINTTIQIIFVITVVGCHCLSMVISHTEMLVGAVIVCLSTFISVADYLRKYYRIWKCNV